MQIAYYASERDNRPTQLDLTWQQLVAELSSPRVAPCTVATCPGKSCEHKRGPAWSPVLLDGPRASQNVVEVYALVLDLDGINREAFNKTSNAILPYKYFAHETHSSRDECWSLRVVFPLVTPVPGKLWKVAHKTMVEELGVPADPACSDPSRLYFFPVRPSDREMAFEDHQEGELLKPPPTLMLAASTPGVFYHNPPGAKLLEPPPIETLVEAAIPLDEIRSAITSRRAAAKREGDAKTYDALGRLLKGKPLAEPGDRDNTINRILAMVAFAVPPETAWEGVEAVVQQSIAAMDTRPEGLAHWLSKAKYSYDRAASRKESQDREKEETRQAILAAQFPGTTEVAEDSDWRGLLTPDGKGEGIKYNGNNINVILENDPDVAGLIKFNAITKDIDVLGGPFQGVSVNVLHTKIADWMHLKHNMKVGQSTAAVKERLASVSRDNTYDPLADYLNGLEWDGVSRAATWLADFARASEDAEGQSPAYLQDIGTRWLISAVARALNPGCKVDTVLVLEGPQGVGKSSLFSVLGGQWFTDTQIAIGNKDGQMLAGSNWIMEMAELASWKRSESAQQKAFFTSREDRIRPPYGHAIESFPRRCVFVGTTNDEQYLTDETGNRRYWVVRCGSGMDLKGLAGARDQLWAEAVHLYKTGARWWLDEEGQKAVDVITNKRLVSSPLLEVISEWWFKKKPHLRPSHIRTLDVARDALKLQDAAMSWTMQRQIADALRKIGFVSSRPYIDGVQTRVWVPEGDALGHHLRLVPDNENKADD